MKCVAAHVVMDLPRANKPPLNSPRITYSPPLRSIFCDGPLAHSMLFLDLGGRVRVPRFYLGLGGCTWDISFSKFSSHVGTVFHQEFLFHGGSINGCVVSHVMEPPVPLSWNLGGVTLIDNPVRFIVLDPAVPGNISELIDTSQAGESG